MNKKLRISLALAGLMVMGGCGFFDDPIPDDVSILVSGTAGDSVRVVLSKDFVAGPNQSGGTDVNVFTSDTVFTVLPVDTTVNISWERRIYFDVTPLGQDSTVLSVSVAIDGRSIFDDSGSVLAIRPFRFLYLWNQYYTSTIDLL
ncbi:MAG: hypothetical protein OEZ65_10175 [Gemmatimonadota bacterium]|nr:hypothetical protein [Gemmatimonadota bacterium]